MIPASYERNPNRQQRTLRLHSLISHKWHRSLALTTLLIACVTVGPLLLVLAWLIQRWAIASIWDSRDRWAGIKAFAFFFALCYLPIILLRDTFAHVWLLLHAPGTFSLWNSALRWLCVLPLAPTFALILERINPQTIRYLVRIRLSSEIPQPSVSAQPAAKIPPPSHTLSHKRRSTQPRPSAATPPSHKMPSHPTRAPKQRDPRPLWETLQDSPTHQAGQNTSKPTINWNEVDEGSLKDF